MIFMGTPGMLIVDRKKNKKYRFDKNGEIEITDERDIRRFALKLKAKKEALDCPQCGKTFKNASGLKGHLRFCGEGKA